jgi:transcriptional regulator with XRE-family HTH domain
VSITLDNKINFWTPRLSSIVDMPEFNAKEFGAWLRQKREELRLSVTELALRAGLSKQYVSLLERGEKHLLTNKPTQPALDKVERLARVLEVDPAEAREIAGYSAQNVRDKPHSVAEFAERLQEMGFDFYSFSLDETAELGPDDLQDLIDQIEANILFKTRRKKEASIR